MLHDVVDEDTGFGGAGFVAYLASPEAAYITGASLTIDGGFAA